MIFRFNYTLYTPFLPNLLDDKQLVQGTVAKNYTPTIPQLYPYTKTYGLLLCIRERSFA